MAAVRRSDAATAYTVQLTRVGIETHWIHNFRELQVTQRQSPCVTLAKLSSPRERVLSACVDPRVRVSPRSFETAVEARGGLCRLLFGLSVGGPRQN